MLGSARNLGGRGQVGVAVTLAVEGETNVKPT